MESKSPYIVNKNAPVLERVVLRPVSPVPTRPVTDPPIIAPGESVVVGDASPECTKNYPGREQAEALGYAFRRLWSGAERAMYTKGNLSLLICYVNDCELEFILSTQIREAHIVIGPLPFPHSRFRVFEQRLQDILDCCFELPPAQ